jgi:hypothetical protein
MHLALRSSLCLVLSALASCGASHTPVSNASVTAAPDGTLIYLGTDHAVQCFDGVLSMLKLRHNIAREPLGTPTPVATVRWYPSGEAQAAKVACYVNSCMEGGPSGPSDIAKSETKCGK